MDLAFTKCLKKGVAERIGDILKALYKILKKKYINCLKYSHNLQK